jgi:hypothetical protein
MLRGPTCGKPAALWRPESRLEAESSGGNSTSDSRFSSGASSLVYKICEQVLHDNASLCAELRIRRSSA